MDVGDRVWAGDKPCYLLIVRDGLATVIDVDERDWPGIHAELMRGEATWHLVLKEHNRIVFTMVVLEGEQPYYVARHFARSTMEGVPMRQTEAHGIGKKRLDGHVDRLWVFPNGQICSGDDVDILGRVMLAGG